MQITMSAKLGSDAILAACVSQSFLAGPVDQRASDWDHARTEIQTKRTTYINTISILR